MATKLDPNKASYLFSKEEIEALEKDMEKMEKDPSGINEEHALGNYACSRDKKKLNKKDKQLFEAMSFIPKEDGLLSAELTIKKDEGVFLKESDEKDKEFREKALKQAESIEKGLTSQTGLAKLWTIQKIFGTDPEALVTEEESFNKLVKCPQEPEDSLYRQMRSKRRYPVMDTVFRVDCPLCKAQGFLKFLFFKIKCFKCDGLRSVLTDAKTYYKSLSNKAEYNKTASKTWRQQYYEEEKGRKGLCDITD
jgi:hypothetical protein